MEEEEEDEDPVETDAALCGLDRLKMTPSGCNYWLTSFSARCVGRLLTWVQLKVEKKLYREILHYCCTVFSLT